MIRKNNSKSFAQKQNLPTTLPPLKKTNKTGDEIPLKNPCTTTRPVVFVIRKRNSSFMQSLTNRKGQLTKQNQIHRQISLKHHSKENQKQQIQKRQALISRDENKQMVSICSIQVQQFTKTNKEVNYRRMQEQQKTTNIQPLLIENRSTSTQKNAMKKTGKKRKIQQCKIRKINWGTRNGFFDLGISAIKLNSQQTANTPVQSLHQLYYQMF